MEEKVLNKWQQEVEDKIDWCGTEENYIGLSPEDLWASSLQARDERIEALAERADKAEAALKVARTQLAAAEQESERLRKRVEELESSTQFYKAAAKTRLTAKLADERKKVVEEIAEYVDTEFDWLAKNIRRKFIEDSKGESNGSKTN